MLTAKRPCQVSYMRCSLCRFPKNGPLTVCADTTHKFAMRTTGFWGLLSKMRMLGSLLSRSGRALCITAMNCMTYTIPYSKLKYYIHET